LDKNFAEKVIKFKFSLSKK
jgi:hypothetical protein